MTIWRTEVHVIHLFVRRWRLPLQTIWSQTKPDNVDPAASADPEPFEPAYDISVLWRGSGDTYCIVQ